MTESSLMGYLLARHKELSERIEKGKGTWGEPGYIKDAEWAALIARRSEVTMILYKLQQQHKAGLTSGWLRVHQTSQSRSPSRFVGSGPGRQQSTRYDAFSPKARGQSRGVHAYAVS